MTVYVLQEWDNYFGNDGDWKNVRVVTSLEVAENWLRHGKNGQPDPDRSYMEFNVVDSFYDEVDKRTYA